MVQLGVFVLFLILTVSKVADAAAVKPPVVIDNSSLRGTTQGIKEIFDGRCLDYLKRYANTESLPAEIVNVKDPVAFCKDVWAEFYKAWGGKNICTVKEERYNGYFKITGAEKKISNKVTLVSNVRNA